MLDNVRQTRLASGARVITAGGKHVESAALGIWAGVGGRHEPEPLCGVSHFIEHLLFKGTRRRTARAISQEIEGRGGYLNAFTQEESTCYYARIAAEHTWHAFDVLADMYLHASLPAVELEKERGVIIEEIMMYRDQPHHAVQEDLRELLWADHPLGRNLAGSPDSIAAMKRRSILGYLREKYVGANTVFAFSGNVDHDACVERVATIESRLPKRRRPSFRPVDRGTRQKRIGAAHRDIEQVHLAMGFRVFGRDDPRRFALKLLSAVLGENMSSRLFQVVREKHGLAYSIHTGTQLFHGTGAFLISAGLEKTKTAKALSLIFTELDRIRERPVGERELKRAKDYVTGQLRLGLESTTNCMIWVGENLISHGRFVPPSEIVDSLMRVTAADVRSVAHQILRRRVASVAVIGPQRIEAARGTVRACLRRL
ncbi:MAG: insulinase family protein [Kiritimatiellae bacterium]|nr:insulinase family protein [Kiritimatiellia bacterium]